MLFNYQSDFQPFSGQGANVANNASQYSTPQFATVGTQTGAQQQLQTLLTQGLQGNGAFAAPSAPNVQAVQTPNIDPASTAAYIQQSVAAPLLQQYDQSIMPRINDAYASVGALMSSRRGFANQQALNDLQTTIASQLGNAQLSNQQLSANLTNQNALNAQNLNNSNYQAQLNNSAQRQQIAQGLIGQSQMAIQPYVPVAPGAGSGGSIQLGGSIGGFNGLQSVFGQPNYTPVGNTPSYGASPQSFSTYGGVSTGQQGSPLFSALLAGNPTSGSGYSGYNAGDSF